MKIVTFNEIYHFLGLRFSFEIIKMLENFTQIQQHIKYVLELVMLEISSLSHTSRTKISSIVGFLMLEISSLPHTSQTKINNIVGFLLFEVVILKGSCEREIMSCYIKGILRERLLDNSFESLTPVSMVCFQAQVERR